jgi:hypothetical protein
MYKENLGENTKRWITLSTMSDPSLMMSLLKISVIFDSSPLLLSRMLLTKVPLLLPVSI